MSDEKNYYLERKHNEIKRDYLKNQLEGYEDVLFDFYQHMDGYEHFPHCLEDEVALIKEENRLLSEATKLIMKCKSLRENKKNACYIDL